MKCDIKKARKVFRCNVQLQKGGKWGFFQVNYSLALRMSLHFNENVLMLQAFNLFVDRMWMRQKRFQHILIGAHSAKCRKLSRPLRNLMLNMSQITLTFRRTFPFFLCLSNRDSLLTFNFISWVLPDIVSVLGKTKRNTKTSMQNNRKMFEYCVVGKMKICVQTSSRKWNEDVLLRNECMIFK